MNLNLTNVALAILYGWYLAGLVVYARRRMERARVEAICRGIIRGLTKFREGGAEVVPAGGNEVVPS